MRDHLTLFAYIANKKHLQELTVNAAFYER